MQVIVNTTFLINIISSDISVLEKIVAKTITEVFDEIYFELGIDLKSESNVKIIETEKSKINLPITKRKKISNMDYKLLTTANKNKKKCILITDDKILRQLAISNKIRTYTTPQFIIFMFKKSKLSFKETLSVLNKIKMIYIRPKDIDKVEEYIYKWK